MGTPNDGKSRGRETHKGGRTGVARSQENYLESGDMEVKGIYILKVFSREEQ